MTKEDCEDLFPTEPEPAGQFDNRCVNVPDDALPLCPKCLKPCQPLAYYCDNCGSNDAINPLTPYIPFLNIRFNYDIFCTMWRKIWYEKNTPAVRKLFYLFMFILYAPILLMVGLPVFLIYKIPQPRTYFANPAGGFAKWVRAGARGPGRSAAQQNRCGGAFGGG